MHWKCWSIDAANCVKPTSASCRAVPCRAVPCRAAWRAASQLKGSEPPIHLPRQRKFTDKMSAGVKPRHTRARTKTEPDAEKGACQGGTVARGAFTAQFHYVKQTSAGVWRMDSSRIRIEIGLPFLRMLLPLCCCCCCSQADDENARCGRCDWWAMDWCQQEQHIEYWCASISTWNSEKFRT